MLKLLREPKPLRLEEFQSILASYGYTLQHAKGKEQDYMAIFPAFNNAII